MYVSLILKKRWTVLIDKNCGWQVLTTNGRTGNVFKLSIVCMHVLSLVLDLIMNVQILLIVQSVYGRDAF